jgi:hypothetical protein
MVNKDYMLINACIEENNKFNHFSQETKDNVEYPLDEDIIPLITSIMNSIKNSKDDYEIFKHLDLLSKLWKTLIEKAIKCLRYFDDREPFSKIPGKKPITYGIDSLYDYFMNYTEYERILYGSSKYYREHVVHVFRTWLSGLYCLIKNKGKYLQSIDINEEELELNNCEKLSIWTIIALTHDLGYPLEKAKGIIETTKKMVSTFITNPDISMDLTFHGVQNYMNDFIVRLMSSKMISKDTYNPKKPFVARLQPKYYFKFQKSLEKNKHGILSAIIIYKLLTYFLESDYNINEDYPFDEKERRQFYIRREILRSIASHTCKDVYHLFMSSFAFLLIIADDTQEWGRKYISELYVEANQEHEFDDIKLTVADNNMKNSCELNENITLKEGQDIEVIGELLKKLHNQAIKYITLFRDGQDTEKRNFTFVKNCNIKYESISPIIFKVKLEINNESKATLKCEISYSSNGDINKKFNEVFFQESFRKDKNGQETEWWNDIKNVIDDGKADLEKPETWKKGIVNFPLIH